MRKIFIKYVSANIIGMIALSCYILADTFFVSQGLGANGLTALNLAISMYSLINGTGLMIGIGGGTRYSIYQAQGKKEKANIIFTNSIKLGLIFGVIYLLVGVFASTQISILLGADESTLAMTSIYLKTIFCFSPFYILNNILIGFVRNDGDPKLPMVGMLVGSLSNIVLDYVFIFPFGWGMFGAAFATGLAPVISICILMKHYIDKKSKFHFQKSSISIKAIGSVCSLGVSSFIGEMASGIILVIFNLLILQIAGNTGVAAYGVVANLALVATSIYTGVSQGSQPLVSDYFGRRDFKSIKKVMQYAIYVSLGISILLYGCISLFHVQMVEIFNKDQIEILSTMASYGLRVYFIGFFFSGINIILSSILSSMDAPKESFIVSMLRSGCLIIPLALILSSKLQMTGVWLSFPLSELLTLIMGIIISKKKWRRKK